MPEICTRDNLSQGGRSGDCATGTDDTGETSSSSDCATETDDTGETSSSNDCAIGTDDTGETSTRRGTEPQHDKTIKMICVPSEDSDQPGHLPSLIRVFAVRFMGS